MTIDTNTKPQPTAFEAARASLAQHVGHAYLAGAKSVGQTAHIACDMLRAIAATNTREIVLTVGEGDKARDVPFNRATLTARAMNKLPTKLAEASSDTPRAEDMIAALANLSPEYVAAKEARDKARLASENHTGKITDDLQAHADKSNGDSALGTLKKPLRDAMLLVAYALVMEGAEAGDLDISKLRVSKRTLNVGMRTADNVDVCDFIPVPIDLAGKRFKSRKPQNATGEQPPLVDGANGDGAPKSVMISQESMRKGGGARDGLAVAINGIAKLIGTLASDPTLAEREAMIGLYVALERRFADEDYAKVADMRDAYENASDAIDGPTPDESETPESESASESDNLADTLSDVLTGKLTPESDAA